ncbi:MAG: hypothetical protein AAF217_08450 [Pseudomonadota bacterium]
MRFQNFMALLRGVVVVESILVTDSTVVTVTIGLGTERPVDVELTITDDLARCGVRIIQFLKDCSTEVVKLDISVVGVSVIARVLGTVTAHCKLETWTEVNI